MLTSEQFKEKSANLSEIVGKQLNVTTASGIDDANQYSKPSEVLAEVKNRLQEGSLRVLVMGNFNAGKSTFLNALMGKNLLPTKVIPATAVISEIVYADEASATLFPKKGKGKGGEEPFNVKIEALQDYILIDHKAPQNDEIKVENPYEKVIVKYPLNICKLGIELVDSPGLNDPTCHDEITLNYLPTADAIVYCMNSQMAFTAFDKAEIEHLRALGYKSIIFVLTYFDVLEQQDLMTGGNNAKTARNHYTNVLSPYTDLGSDGIFFVGSLPALMGKIKNDTNLLESSHLPEMEKKLEQILFNERGRLKLIKAIYSVKKVNRETCRFLSDKIELYKQDQTSLAGKLNSAQLNLDKAKEKARLVSSNFSSGANELVNGIEERSRLYFTTEVLPHIDEWVNEFKPSEDEGISMWHPKRSGKAFSEGCIKYFQMKMETSIGAWCTETLVPEYIEPRLKMLAEQQNSNIAALDEDLKSVRGNLSLSIIPDEPEIGGANRIFSAIAGVLLLNPAAAITGGTLGWQGLVPTLVTTIVTNIVLYIVAFFTGPIGWVTMIIANVVAFIVGSIAGTGKIEDRVKKKIASEIKTEILRHQEEFVNNITKSVREIVDKLKVAVDKEIFQPVNQYQKLLDDAEKDVNAQGTTIQDQIKTKIARLNENNAIADELEDFAHEININI